MNHFLNIPLNGCPRTTESVGTVVIKPNQIAFLLQYILLNKLSEVAMTNLVNQFLNPCKDCPYHERICNPRIIVEPYEGNESVFLLLPQPLYKDMVNKNN